MGTTNFNNSVRTAAILISDGVKDEAKVNICKIDTGSYIYEAFMKIYNGNNTEIYVTKSSKVSMTNRYSQVLARTQVRVSNHGIEYSNQGGKINIPASVSKKLVLFVKELSYYMNHR